MQITNELIGSLLFEEEGTTLDFKRDQYPFEDAGKVEKSELLKDILAFTNAFRRSDAFILIGVEEVKGGKSKIVGVATQLDDAKLQQFVNSKTQRPVTFSYRELVHDSVPIGVIHIPVQKRPVHAKADFGIVKKDTVYLRRGSSTDIAKPDEIVQMGADQAVQLGAEPAFALTLIDRKSDNSLGEKIELHSLWLEIPKENDIPDYEEERDMFMTHIGINRDYYRDLAKFTQKISFYQPVTLAIQNTGGVTAHDVRLVFEIDDPDRHYGFMEEDDMPNPPKSSWNNLGFVNLPTQTFHSDITVTRIGDKWRNECRFGKIQPQETAVLPDDLYVAARQSGALLVEAKIYADNISAPRPVRFELQFQAESKDVSLEDIEKMQMERFLQTEQGKRLMAEMQENGEDQDP